MAFKPVTHVIFDLDGTILDTEVIYERVLQELAHWHATEYSHEVRMKILGRNEQDTAKIFLADLGLENKLTPTEFLKEYRERNTKALVGVNLLPGAERLITHLHKHKIPFAIATSSSDDMVDIKTAHLKELFDLFHHKVMGSTDPEVKNGKPAPDIYLVCAARFNPAADPKECLVFEDAPNGAKGGLAAGMQVVAIPQETVSKDLFPTETTQFLNSLEMFKPEDFNLPPYENE